MRRRLGHLCQCLRRRALGHGHEPAEPLRGTSGLLLVEHPGESRSPRRVPGATRLLHELCALPLAGVAPYVLRRAVLGGSQVDV